MLRRLSLSRKLTLAVAVPMVLFLVSAAVTFRYINRVKVNGPEYAKVVDAKDLVADILPPPNYIVETHLIAAQVLRTPAGAYPARKEKLESLRQEYETRIKVWQDKLENPQTRSVFLDQAYPAARQYFEILFGTFLPAMERAYANGWVPADSAGASFVLDTDFSDANRTFSERLEPLYAEHKSAIDQTVLLARADESAVQSDAAATVSTATRLTFVVTILGALTAALFGIAITRAIRKPVLRLTEVARLAATESLPRVVAEAQLAGADDEVRLPAVDVDSEDELGELAQAFTSMQDTAVTLAVEQARVRRNVAENLVNLARRNQALLGRSLSLLTKLENDERDPDKLDELFRVDHLTTRMRRNADSLLVLAGSEAVRTWSEPVDVGDVVRAAVSAIEAYDRVEITALEPVRVKGKAAGDVSHIVAELLENATAFSPPTSQVSVMGRYRAGGYLLVVTDDGIGMNAEDLAAANQRIREFAAFDSTPTKVLGLSVVGRLSSRLGIEVSLSESSTSGISARILLPVSLIEVAEGFGDSVFDTSSGLGFESVEPAMAGAPVATAPSRAAASSAFDFPFGDANAAAAAPSLDQWGRQPAPEDWGTERVAYDGEPAWPHAESAATEQAGSWGAAEYGWEHAGDPAVSQAAPAWDAEATSADDVHDVPQRTGGLAKRVRGAQMPDTGPAREESWVDVSPDQVMGSLASLQGGVERGRRDADLAMFPADTASDAGSADDSAAWAYDGDDDEFGRPAWLPESEGHRVAASDVDEAIAELADTEATANLWAPEPSGSSDSGSFDSGTFDAGPVEPAVAMAAPAGPVGPGGPAEATTASGLKRRVKGAQMPDLGPAAEDQAPVALEPEVVRTSLASLQTGISEALRQLPSDSADPLAGD